jgi:hypothetical protein
MTIGVQHRAQLFSKQSSANTGRASAANNRIRGKGIQIRRGQGRLRASASASQPRLKCPGEIFER